MEYVRGTRNSHCRMGARGLPTRRHPTWLFLGSILILSACGSTGVTGTTTAQRSSSPTAASSRAASWQQESLNVSPSTSVPSIELTINAISCPTTSDCWAVGQGWTAPNGYGSGSKEEPLLLHFTGSSWMSVAPPDNSAGLELMAVACPTSSACEAVGVDSIGTVFLGYAGSTWSDQPTGPSVATSGPELTSVACVDATDCWAVGNWSGYQNEETEPVIDQFSGGTWTQTPIPHPADGMNLSAVACLPTASCVAVGSLQGAPLALDLASGKWSGAQSISGAAQLPIPELVGVPQPNSGLSSVACDPRGACWALGYFPAPGGQCGDDQCLLAASDTAGSWSVPATPPPVPADEVYADGSISCPAADNCWAVGFARSDSKTAPSPIISHLADGQWSTTTMPGDGELTSVSCATSTDCWAVGAPIQTNSTTPPPLLYHYAST